jgi:hypothetical protein
MAEKSPTVTTAHDEFDTHAGVYTVKKDSRPRGSDDEAGSNGSSTGLKTAKDGVTVLIPQPSEDPHDPLNWSWVKKNAVFMSLLPGCFLTDWVITWGTVLFEQQVRAALSDLSLLDH